MWLALALLNPLLLLFPPVIMLAIRKAMQYEIVSRTDPVDEPDLL
jgi:hypothetical protein